ncbi:CwfJ C-terminus 1-domain-containing protein-like protein [Blastocladiella britannica]|nr:CwfJ C-terminus 1-domain-containing protein-like protein [Blastocladiella britannica]
MSTKINMSDDRSDDKSDHTHRHHRGHRDSSSSDRPEMEKKREMDKERRSSRTTNDPEHDRTRDRPSSSSHRDHDRGHDRAHERESEHSATTAPPVRESWMTGASGADDHAMAGLFGAARDDRRSSRRAATDKVAQERAASGVKTVSSREINPYWKSGGQGLPPLAAPASPGGAQYESGAESDSSVASTASHFAMRKIDRVIEIASEEGRPLEQVGAERFGSLEAFREAYSAYDSARKPRTTTAATSQRGSRPSGLRVASLPATTTTESAPSTAATGVVPVDPGEMSLEDMVREERASRRPGARGHRGIDADFAKRISRDSAFKDDLDYMDEQADRLGGAPGTTTGTGKGKHRASATASSSSSSTRMQRGLAFTTGSGSGSSKNGVSSIDDLVARRKALEKCQLCFRDGGKLPDLPTIVSVGIKAYLVIMPFRSIATCQIVPVDHLTSSLNGDDAFWDEVRNFMKCLMIMYAGRGQRVLFSETVLNASSHRHTAIEVIPVPEHVAEDAPGYISTAFRADAEADEWTQHQPVIDTRKKDNGSGGFRRSMVSHLPYVHVWYDLDGGHGHVIEEGARGMDETFVRETLVGAMDADMALARRGKWLSRQENHERVRAFVKDWAEHDWTKMLDGGQYGS